MDRFAFNEEVDGMQGVIVLCNSRSAESGLGLIGWGGVDVEEIRFGSGLFGSRSADRRRGMRKATKTIAKSTVAAPTAVLARKSRSA